jgi:hypothetical protein
VTLAFQAAKVFAVVAILVGAFSLLPAAGALDSTPVTIPDVLWDPIAGALQLNRYFPMLALLNVARLSLAIVAGLGAWFLVSWALKRLLG